MTDTSASEATLLELIPGLAGQHGPIPLSTAPTSIRNSIARNVETWDELATLTVSDILRWPSVGGLRAARIVGFARAAAARLPAPTSPGRTLDELARPFADELRTLAAWALSCGVSEGIDRALVVADRADAPADVVAAAAALRGAQLADLVSSDDVARFDPVESARRLLDGFDARDIDVLRRMLSRGLRDVEKLQEIGRRHGVTGTRVQQLEVQLRKRLRTALDSAEHLLVRDRAAALGEALGAVCAVDDMPAVYRPASDRDLVDDLLLHLAGPYRHADGLLFRDPLPPDPDKVVASAFDRVSARGVASLDAVAEALVADGVRREMVPRLLAAAGQFRIVDDHLLTP